MSDGPVLHVLSGDLAGRTYRVNEREFVIGRAPSCDLVIPKRYISREHARIEARRKRFTVSSLSEKNPVHLRDRPVRKTTELADGDEFELCGIRFRFDLEGEVRGRKVEGVRMSGSAAGRVGAGWQDAPPADDGWQDAPADDDGWQDAPADDGWRDEPAPPAPAADDGWDEEEEGDWEDEPEPAPPPRRKPSRRAARLDKDKAPKPDAKGSVVFGDEDDDGEGEEDTEEVNEKTAELNPTVDPDDPDYDPFAEVDNRIKKEKKQTDPQREKLLRVLLGVAVVGILFAGYVIYQISQKPPLTVVQHNDGEELVVAVDETVVIDYPYADANPPQGAESRRIDVRGNYQKFYEDDSVQVEWLNYKNRAVLLIRGLETGPSKFSLFFPVRNTRLEFNVSVEGDPPLQREREARQAEFKKLQPNKLRSILAQAVEDGDTYLKGYGPGKEHHLWLALQEYEKAIDAGDAMRDLSANMNQALSQTDRENLAKANRKAEETREDYDRKREQLHQRYAQTFEQGLKKEQKLAALRSLMRGIGNPKDMQFIRLKILLEEPGGYGERWTGF
ncbi:MAG: FHA domain-containing protein [Planctomycetota bacterium]